MPKNNEKTKEAHGKGRGRAKKKPVTGGDRPLGPAEAEILADARMYLNDSRERKENSDLYRWAKLVVERHKAGRSIANAKATWLGAIMAGGIDPEYLD